MIDTSSMNSFESELIREGTTQYPINSNQLHFESSFQQIPSISFPETKEATNADKARQILGESGKYITDDQLETFIAQIELLMNSWLDSYERQLFDGKTLREITK